MNGCNAICIGDGATLAAMTEKLDPRIEKLHDADIGLARAMADLRRAIGDVGEHTASMHISVRSPRALEGLAQELRNLLGDSVDDR